MMIEDAYISLVLIISRIASKYETYNLGNTLNKHTLLVIEKVAFILSNYI